MTHTCKRCGHQWVPRLRKREVKGSFDNGGVDYVAYVEVTPVRCPRCQSPYWQRERQAAKVVAKGDTNGKV